MNRVLITGVTGFIGGHIAELFLARGIQTGGLVRRPETAAWLADKGLQVKPGDLTRPESLQQALRGYDCVIHAAAYVRDWGKYEQFYQTNVVGTQNLLRACKANGINRVILTGTNAYYGEEDCLRLKNENSPRQPHYPYFGERLFANGLNHYRDTKAMAKDWAVEFAAAQGINLTILEPVWVFGERESHVGFYEYLKTAVSGIPWVPGSKANKFHVIYVRDLAHAYWSAFEKALPGVHSFLIGNQTADNMDQMYALFCREAGIKKPGNLPKWIFYPLGFLLEWFGTWFGFKKPPLLTRSRVNMFYDNIEYSVARARAELGFVNAHSLAEGVRKTVAWYKTQHWL